MPRQYTPRVSCVCRTCGKGFSVIPSKFKIGYGKYCSHPCAQIGGKGRKVGTPEQRFWKKVDIRSEGECWEWQGSRWQNGYGMFFSPEGKIIKAHRFSLEMKLGRSIAEGMLSLHSCDNPPCVNPSHLREGTVQMNADDKVQRGRSAAGDRNGMRLHPERTLKGVKQPMAVLTDDAVRDIRARYAPRRFSQQRLAHEYGVSQAVISSVLRGKTWKHVA